MESRIFKAGENEYRISYFPQLVSTNDQAACGSYRHGDVILAACQTRGRGQRGNFWHSAPGQNLTFSLVAEPCFLPAARQFLLSEAVSLAVTDMLGNYGIESSIKWPNDIYVGDKKIAGILIENDIYGSAISRSVIGIGLNVNQASFPDHLPNPTSMIAATGHKLLDPDIVLDSFLENFTVRYGLLRDGDTGRITGDYHSLIYRKDIRTRFRLPDGARFTGLIRQVKDNGILLVETESGSEREFLFKEVELVL